MAWRDLLLPGSFRGVPFQVEAHGHSGGRRGQLHEYPQRDTPYFEDLGRKTREFSIDVFILGDNYTATRDAMLAACESEGNGTLVHPYLGSKQVICTNFALSERIDEGRVCRFTLTFIEAGAKQFPAGVSDLAGKIDGLAGLAELAAVRDFLGRYTAAGLPGFVFDSVEAVAGRLIETLTGFNGGEEFAGQLLDFGSDLENLVRQPQALAERVLGIVRSLRDGLQPTRRNSTTATAAASVMREIGQFSVADEVADIPQTTQTRVAQASNIDAFAAIVRRAALINEAKAVPAIAPDSYQDAVAYSRDYVSRTDDELLRVDSENAYLPLTNIASAVSAELNVKAGALPQIVRLTLTETQPSLVTAYEKYADSKRAPDIERRNPVRNPSFMPAGVPLEVLAT